MVEWGVENDGFWGDGPKTFLRLRPTTSLLDCERAAIKEVREGRYGLEIELHDKVAALALLAKHFGLLDGAGREKEDLVDGVPRIPLATLRLLQKRNEELQEKLKEDGSPSGTGRQLGDRLRASATSRWQASAHHVRSAIGTVIPTSLGFRRRLVDV